MGHPTRHVPGAEAHFFKALAYLRDKCLMLRDKCLMLGGK